MSMREYVLFGAVDSCLGIMIVASFRIKLALQKAELERWKETKPLVTEDRETILPYLGLGLFNVMNQYILLSFKLV